MNNYYKVEDEKRVWSHRLIHEIPVAQAAGLENFIVKIGIKYLLYHVGMNCGIPILLAMLYV